MEIPAGEADEDELPAVPAQALETHLRPQVDDPYGGGSHFRYGIWLGNAALFLWMLFRLHVQSLADKLSEEPEGTPESKHPLEKGCGIILTPWEPQGNPPDHVPIPPSLWLKNYKSHRVFEWVLSLRTRFRRGFMLADTIFTAFPGGFLMGSSVFASFFSGLLLAFLGSPWVPLGFYTGCKGFVGLLLRSSWAPHWLHGFVWASVGFVLGSSWAPDGLLLFCKDLVLGSS